MARHGPCKIKAAVDDQRVSPHWGAWIASVQPDRRSIRLGIHDRLTPLTRTRAPTSRIGSSKHLNAARQNDVVLPGVPRLAASRRCIGVRMMLTPSMKLILVFRRRRDSRQPLDSYGTHGNVLILPSGAGRSSIALADSPRRYLRPLRKRRSHPDRSASPLPLMNASASSGGDIGSR
jgi:hypothetical protein